MRRLQHELASLMETAHLLWSPKNAERLLSALARAQRDEGRPQTVDDLRRDLGLEPRATNPTMEPRLSFVTLGVADLDRSIRFYTEVLGLTRLNDHADVAFFELGRTWLALYPRHLLAADAGVPAEGGGFAGFTLAHNVRREEDVDALLAEVAAGGATIVKPAQQAEWGGRTGYFADPDGFLWEVAWNPHFPHV